MDYKKILVTGGAGFIGSHVVKKLEQKGLEVLVADDFSAGSRDNLREGVPVEVVDISDKVQVSQLFEKYKDEITHVVHLAAYINLQESMNNPDIDATNNIIGMINIIKASRDSGVKKFVFSSSAAVYGIPQNPDLPIDEDQPLHPESPYGVSKVTGEYYLRVLSKDFMSYTTLRFGNIYGERQKLNKEGEGGVIPIFLDSLKNNQPVELRHNGKAIRDYVYVGDIANAVYLGLTAPDGVYNLGTKTGTDVKTLWNILTKYYFNGVSKDIPEAKLVPLQPGEIEKIIVNSDKARDVMGWEPKVPFEQGIERTVNWYINLSPKQQPPISTLK